MARMRGRGVENTSKINSPGPSLHLCSWEWQNWDREIECKVTRPGMPGEIKTAVRRGAVIAEDLHGSRLGLQPVPGRPSGYFIALFLLGVVMLIFVGKPRPGGRVQGPRAKDAAAGSQPPSGKALFLRKACGPSRCVLQPTPRKSSRSFLAPFLLGVVLLVFVGKPRQEGRAHGHKAGDAASGSQPPGGEMPLLRKALLCGGVKGGRKRTESAER